MGLSQRGKVIHQPLITSTGPDIKRGSCTVTARNLRRQALRALIPSQCAFCLALLGLPRVSLSTLIILLHNTCFLHKMWHFLSFYWAVFFFLQWDLLKNSMENQFYSVIFIWISRDMHEPTWMATTVLDTAENFHELCFDELVKSSVLWQIIHYTTEAL